MEEFDKIYARHFSEVYRFVLSLCHDPALAEEVTQESFFKALKSIHSFKGECSIGTWLCRIARNTLYNSLKRLKRRADHPLDDIISFDAVEERFADKETAYAIHKALHSLNEPYREVFWLRVFGELPFARIAELFGKTESWARVTYYRSKVMIKEAIQ